MASLPLKPTAVRLAAIVGVGSLLVGQAPLSAAVLSGGRPRRVQATRAGQAHRPSLAGLFGGWPARS